jgi:hypothetical protein
VRQIRYIKLEPRRGNFLTQALGAVVGLLILAASLILGFFLVAGFLGFGLILALMFYCRLWWLRRKPGGRNLAEEDIIETEYRVVRKEKPGPRDQ